MLMNRYIFKPIMRKWMAKISAFLIAFFLIAGIANAHRVNLFAWVEGNTVYVESKFSGGKKVNAGKIIVTDPQGIELLNGKTDDQGEFSFKIPKKTDLKIVLLAGTGHRAEWMIPAKEIEMPAVEKKPIQEQGPTVMDIIIGVGCIMGLTVFAAYIHNRRKKIKLNPK